MSKTAAILLIAFGCVATAANTNVTVNVHPARKVIHIGEPAAVDIEFINQGRNAIAPQLLYPITVGTFQSLTLKMVDRGEGPSSIRFRPADARIPAGKSRTFHVVINRYINLNKLGDHQIAYNADIWILDSKGNSANTFNAATVFHLTVEPGAPDRHIFETIKRDLVSKDIVKARFAFDMLLFSRTNGVLELLASNANDQRFSEFRYDTALALAEFLPDDMALTALGQIAPINDSHLLTTTVQIVENHGLHFPSEAFEAWLTASGDSARAAAIRFLTRSNYLSYADLMRKFAMSDNPELKSAVNGYLAKIELLDRE